MGWFKVFRDLFSGGFNPRSGFHGLKKGQRKTGAEPHKEEIEGALSDKQIPSASVGFFYIHGTAPGTDGGFSDTSKNLSTPLQKINQILSKLAILAIKFYQKFISPGIPHTCRFYPTCSEYSIQAISKYGILKGGILSIWRIIRCNPFNPGGYDPVK